MIGYHRRKEKRLNIVENCQLPSIITKLSFIFLLLVVICAINFCWIQMVTKWPAVYSHDKPQNKFDGIFRITYINIFHLVDPFHQFSNIRIIIRLTVKYTHCLFPRNDRHLCIAFNQLSNSEVNNSSRVESHSYTF